MDHGLVIESRKPFVKSPHVGPLVFEHGLDHVHFDKNPLVGPFVFDHGLDHVQFVKKTHVGPFVFDHGLDHVQFVKDPVCFRSWFRSCALC